MDFELNCDVQVLASRVRTNGPVWCVLYTNQQIRLAVRVRMCQSAARRCAWVPGANAVVRKVGSHLRRVLRIER